MTIYVLPGCLSVTGGFWTEPLRFEVTSERSLSFMHYHSNPFFECQNGKRERKTNTDDKIYVFKLKKKKIKYLSNLYHTENSKNRGQTLIPRFL